MKEGIVDGVKWTATGPPGVKVMPRYRIDKTGIKNTYYASNPQVAKVIRHCNRQYEQKVYQQWQAQRRYKDMIYNYMVKTEEENRKKVKQKKKQLRAKRQKLLEKFWQNYEPIKFVCGCNTIFYKSYLALWVHIKLTHRGVIPAGTIQGQCGKHETYISYPEHILQFQEEYQ